MRKTAENIQFLGAKSNSLTRYAIKDEKSAPNRIFHMCKKSNDRD